MLGEASLLLFSLQPVIWRIACSSGSFSVMSHTVRFRGRVSFHRWSYKVSPLRHAVSAGSFWRHAAVCIHPLLQIVFVRDGGTHPRGGILKRSADPFHPSGQFLELVRILRDDFCHYFLFFTSPSSSILCMSVSL